MIKLSEKDFKATIIFMFSEIEMSILEMNGKIVL